MHYASEDGSIMEVIWNSRDGVTPFCIASKDGETELRHVDWHLDRPAPLHKPQPGDRVFVDMTEERATEKAEAFVEAHWEAKEFPMRKYFASREMAIAHYASEWCQPGAPDLIEVEKSTMTITRE
jgi:hypothetical protein